MKHMKSILLIVLLAAGLTVTVLPDAHACDHEYDDIETEPVQRPS
jgi:hypothetical protein